MTSSGWEMSAPLGRASLLGDDKLGVDLDVDEVGHDSRRPRLRLGEFTHNSRESAHVR